MGSLKCRESCSGNPSLPAHKRFSTTGSFLWLPGKSREQKTKVGPQRKSLHLEPFGSEYEYEPGGCGRAGVSATLKPRPSHSTFLHGEGPRYLPSQGHSTHMRASKPCGFIKPYGISEASTDLGQEIYKLCGVSHKFPGDLMRKDSSSSPPSRDTKC